MSFYTKLDQVQKEWLGIYGEDNFRRLDQAGAQDIVVGKANVLRGGRAAPGKLVAKSKHKRLNLKRTLNSCAKVILLRRHSDDVKHFQLAARRGDWKSVETLVHKGNFSPYDTTPLHIACGLRDIKIVSTLLKIYKGNRYVELLGSACMHGTIDIVTLFLSRCSLHEELDVPFRLACKNGNLQVVKMLLNDGRVYPWSKESLCFRIAAVRSNLAVLRVLLEDNRVDPAACHNEAIRVAAKSGNDDIVKCLLLDRRVDPRSSESYALRWACRNGHVSCVRLLLDDNRSDPSAMEGYSLTWASKNGHIEVVRTLLKQPGVDPAADDSDCLRLAVQYGHLEVVQVLISDGRARPGANASWSIRVAAERGRRKVFRALLEDGRANPAACQGECLRVASRRGETLMVQLLLQDKRVDPCVLNSKALRSAGRNGHHKIVALLLEDGRVKTCAYDYEVLHAAVENGHKSVVQILLQYGQVNVENWTKALHTACLEGYDEIVRLLLADGRAEPMLSDCIQASITCNSPSVVGHLLEDDRVDLNGLQIRDLVGSSIEVLKLFAFKLTHRNDVYRVAVACSNGGFESHCRLQHSRCIPILFPTPKLLRISRRKGVYSPHRLYHHVFLVNALTEILGPDMVRQILSYSGDWHLVRLMF
mmetsp:Transcript_18214/g.29609  ORF Transcript_18214/g.29609 Transcript_18214/m.29609 type:complete len:647 (-) Transcript_18214:543-2483(-)